MLEYNMFQNAVCTFEDTQTLCIEMADSIVAEGKKDAIVGQLTGFLMSGVRFRQRSKYCTGSRKKARIRNMGKSGSSRR